MKFKWVVTTYARHLDRKCSSTCSFRALIPSCVIKIDVINLRDCDVSSDHQ